MTFQETLNQIERLRRLGRDERIERAKKLTVDFQEAAVQVKNGTRLEDLPADVQDLLLSCSEAVFQKFELLVGRAPALSRGGQRFTEPRKVS